jgi:hypothetical protein
VVQSDEAEIRPLFKHWTHSHEEDTGGSQVYRPAGHPFPPSRGRIAFEFKPDGELLYGGIGPTDRQTLSSGTWNLAEDGRTLVLRVPDEVEQTLEIESLSDDRLVVRRLDSRA